MEGLTLVVPPKSEDKAVIGKGKSEFLIPWLMCCPSPGWLDQDAKYFKSRTWAVGSSIAQKQALPS